MNVGSHICGSSSASVLQVQALRDVTTHSLLMHLSTRYDTHVTTVQSMDSRESVTRWTVTRWTGRRHGNELA